MKKNLLLIVLFFSFHAAIFAQISTLPYTEDFESPFAQGTNTMFVPNFTGNTVAATNRICQDGANHYSGAASCAVTPTSSFDGIILINLNLSSYSNVYMSFYAATAMNGTGTRSASVEISTSIDGGYSYSPVTIIGDPVAFANANTPWNNYHYALPYYSNLNSNVIVKIKVTRGDGTGTTARWLLDDVVFDHTTNDITAPIVYNAYASGLNQIKVAFSEPVNASANNVTNYSGVSNVSSANSSTQSDTISLQLSSPLVLGQWYTLTVSGIQDLSSNAMSGSQQFIIVYNNNIGNVKMTEINYDNPGNDSLAFVELKNIDSQPINVGGWRFNKGLTGYLPSNKVLQPEEYIVVAQFPTVVNSFFGITSFPVSGNLSNSGETISLENSESVLIDSVSYSNLAPWDTLANGYGPSLTLCNETSNNDDPANWSASTYYAGLYLGADSIFATPMNNCQMTAGINEASSIGFRVYPIPATNQLTVEFKEATNKPRTVQVFDISGREIKQYSNLVSNCNFEVKLNTSALMPGIYILKVDGSAVRIIKN